MTRTYRVFGASPAAQNFIGRVNTALGYPKPGTATYAQPEETVDGKWAVLIKRDVDADVVPGGGATREEIDHVSRMKSEIDALVIAPPAGSQAAQSGIVERPGAQKAKAG